ncbi:unnamed protein product, partial [Vitis vinifera]
MTFAIAVKNIDKKNPIEDDGIVRILTTRSKLHLKAMVKYYKEIYGKNIDEDLDTLMSLKETLQCLCNPQAYFSKVRLIHHKQYLRNDLIFVCRIMYWIHCFNSFRS